MKFDFIKIGRKPGSFKGFYRGDDKDKDIYAEFYITLDFEKGLGEIIGRGPDECSELSIALNNDRESLMKPDTLIIDKRDRDTGFNMRNINKILKEEQEQI